MNLSLYARAQLVCAVSLIGWALAVRAVPVVLGMALRGVR